MLKLTRLSSWSTTISSSREVAGTEVWANGAFGDEFITLSAHSLEAGINLNFIGIMSHLHILGQYSGMKVGLDQSVDHGINTL